MSEREERLKAELVVAPVADRQPFAVVSDAVDTRILLGGRKRRFPVAPREGDRQLARWVAIAKEDAGEGAAHLLPTIPARQDRRHW